MINDTGNTCTNIVKFLLSKDSIEGTVIDYQVKKLADEKHKAQVYNPKNQGQFNKSLHLFSID